MKRAKENGANEDVLSAIEAMPDDDYEDMADVMQVCSDANADRMCVSGDDEEGGDAEDVDTNSRH